jgi:transposase-like protein
MNDHVTVSTFQLFERFPDNESARLYLEGRLWPNGAICPECKSGERITTRKGGYYRCNACDLDFTVRTGTIFERSHVPLHKWVYAMYLLVTSRKGVSSLQMSKEIGVTQKTAWFMLSRLREACGRKHLHRYVDEFTFRLNAGNVKRTTLERLDSFVAGVVGRRITWKELTA